MFVFAEERLAAVSPSGVPAPVDRQAGNRFGTNRYLAAKISVSFRADVSQGWLLATLAARYCIARQSGSGASAKT